MKTIGGFKIENFRKLEEPIKRGILEPHIYTGTVIDITNENTISITTEVTWDKFGRCSNWDRKDCFINVNEL